jgi:hypothetical protein
VVVSKGGVAQAALLAGWWPAMIGWGGGICYTLLLLCNKELAKLSKIIPKLFLNYS